MKRDKSAAVGLVVCFVAMIAIVGAITFSNYERKQEEEKLAQAEEQIETEEESEEESQSANTDSVQSEIQEQPEEIITETPIVETPIQERPIAFSEQAVLSWPVDGNVILPYSMDQTVYFSTLDQYKYNPAVIISGEVGEKVLAAEDGEVTSIETNAQTGTTVTVNLGDGYEAVYGQLGEVSVKQGQRIEDGDLIGYLGEPTKYYSVEGPNLYFELLKDGEPVNPLQYLDV